MLVASRGNDISLPRPPSAPYLDELTRRYERSVDNLREALRSFIQDGTRPDPECARVGRVRLSRDPHPLSRRSRQVGDRARLGPAERARHLCDQRDPAGPVPRLSGRAARLPARPITTSRSRSATARRKSRSPMCWATGVDVADVMARDLARCFPAPDLAHIGDEVADGVWAPRHGDSYPLALFDALRTDFSLARLRHYTGTAPEHFQRYILFTNYQRYVDHFIRWGAEQVAIRRAASPLWPAPAGMLITPDDADAEGAIADGHVQALPDAGLSPRRGRRDRHHPGQYRRRAVQREDDHRPSRGAAARGVADDRPLRRPEDQPEDRRLCPCPRLSSRRPRARRGAAAVGADPADRRGAAGAAAGRADGVGRG